MRKAIVLFILWGMLVFVLLFSLEQAARSLEPHETIALHRILRDKPYVYGLNPEHPEVNSQGVRGEESGPKLPGQKRILFVGDSITYGLFVPQTEIFTTLLEKRFQEHHQNVQVINAGVNGYTPYNELKWIQTEARSFEPDLIVVVFCLNDLVNPVEHWGDPGGDFKDTPAEAFPDYGEHLTSVAPRLYRSKNKAEQFLERFAIYRILSKWYTVYNYRADRYTVLNGKQWPVYVADESRQSIEVWTNSESQEWKWFEQKVLQMKHAAEQMGAHFEAVLIPLSYQLEDNYPFHPEANFLRFCTKNKMDCLDMLPALKNAKDKSVFMGRHAHHLHDIWHLSPAGHAAAARALYDFLKE